MELDLGHNKKLDDYIRDKQTEQSDSKIEKEPSFIYKRIQKFESLSSPELYSKITQFASTLKNNLDKLAKKISSKQASETEIIHYNRKMFILLELLNDIIENTIEFQDFELSIEDYLLVISPFEKTPNFIFKAMINESKKNIISLNRYKIGNKENDTKPVIHSYYYQKTFIDYLPIRLRLRYEKNGCF